LKNSKVSFGVTSGTFWKFLLISIFQKVKGLVRRLTKACEDDNSENLQWRRCGTKLQVGLPLPSSLPGDAFQLRWRSAGEQAVRKHKSKSLQKGALTLLEASHDHFLVTPPSHFTPQKVEGFVVG
jgi:hypothetical protein